MEKLIKILEEIKPGVDFKAEENLVENHILDSLSVVRLVGELNDEFNIEITPIDIVPENFKSVSSIQSLIERLEDE